MKKLLSALAGKQRRSPARERIILKERPAVLYAIGDVHGCHALLRQLERRIADDGAGIAGEKWIVCLGDYIDRGPASARVLDHLMSPPPDGFRRICLAGNHEQFAFDFFHGEYDNGWLDFGGRETLASYGLYDLESRRTGLARQIVEHVPREHVEFIGSLPALLSIPGFTFVHAGLDPGLPPESQKEETLLWSRPWDFAWPARGTGYRVVHGHTPVTEPDLAADRINIDFGAYSSGRLCALRLLGDEMSLIPAV